MKNKMMEFLVPRSYQVMIARDVVAWLLAFLFVFNIVAHFEILLQWSQWLGAAFRWWQKYTQEFWRWALGFLYIEISTVSAYYLNTFMLGLFALASPIQALVKWVTKKRPAHLVRAHSVFQLLLPVVLFVGLINAPFFAEIFYDNVDRAGMMREQSEIDDSSSRRGVNAAIRARADCEAKYEQLKQDGGIASSITLEKYCDWAIKLEKNAGTLVEKAIYAGRSEAGRTDEEIKTSTPFADQFAGVIALALVIFAMAFVFGWFDPNVVVRIWRIVVLAIAILTLVSIYPIYDWSVSGAAAFSHVSGPQLVRR